MEQYEIKDRNDNRVEDRRPSPSYDDSGSKASVLLNRLRQSPSVSHGESTHSDPGSYSQDRFNDEQRKSVNPANLSPIREHPDERRNRQRRHSNKRRTQGDRALYSRGSRQRGSSSHSGRDGRPDGSQSQSFAVHSRTPSNDSYEAGADSVSYSSVDSIKVRPPAPYLDDDDDEDEYLDDPIDERHFENPDELDSTYRDWV